ncbi:MAG: hypothetical protein V4622_06555 [Bacteroidota bacterium]
MSLVLDSIFKPEGKLTVKLGESDLAKLVLSSFNKRLPRKAFLKNKKFGCAVIDCGKFETYSDFNLTIKGKNSADYYKRRCEKLNYSFVNIDPNLFLDEILEINTSSNNRQGKQMDSDYFVKKSNYPNDDYNLWFGVFNEENKLVSYVWTYYLNELVTFNRILGHSEFLKDNIMYFMTQKTIEYYFDKKEVKSIMYDTFGREKNGLYLFKSRNGFKSYTINFKK